MLHAIVMFEPAMPGEQLSLASQVNQVFGPFANGEEADAWVERACVLIPGREWLVLPLDDFNILHKVQN